MVCTICLKSKRWYQDIRILKCGHKFHLDCIIKWTNTNLTCPNCRTIILKQREMNYSDILLTSKNIHPYFKSTEELLRFCGIEDTNNYNTQPN